MNLQLISGKVSGLHDGGGNAKMLVLDVGKDSKGNPKRVAIRVWSDSTKARVAELAPGTWVNVLYELRSREHNGKYYTDAEAFEILAREKRTATGGHSMRPVGKPQDHAPVDDSDVPF